MKNYFDIVKVFALGETSVQVLKGAEKGTLSKHFPVHSFTFCSFDKAVLCAIVLPELCLQQRVAWGSEFWQTSPCYRP